MISQQNRTIVGPDGKTTQQMMIWINEVTDLQIDIADLQIITGAGSPEGVVEALPRRLYMDTAGTTGNILYIKRDDSIAGDLSKGWILV